jgi:hypothetical protein
VEDFSQRPAQTFLERGIDYGGNPLEAAIDGMGVLVSLSTTKDRNSLSILRYVLYALRLEHFERNGSRMLGPRCPAECFKSTIYALALLIDNFRPWMSSTSDNTMLLTPLPFGLVENLGPFVGSTTSVIAGSLITLSMLGSFNNDVMKRRGRFSLYFHNISPLL